MNASRLAILLSALSLSACADHAPDAIGRASGGDPMVAGGGGALASMPPAAGRVVAVRRTPYANGFTQDIVMEGPLAMAGENRITVQALTTAGGVGRYGGDDELRLGPPTDQEISAEMEARIPGVAMRFSGVGERNRLGLFGYAVGETGRLTCVYAWQYVTPARPLSLIEGAIGTGALPLGLRVRLCRDLPAATLVGYLRDLNLAAAEPAFSTAADRPASASDALAAAVGTDLALPTRLSEAAPVVRHPTRGVQHRRHGRWRFIALLRPHHAHGIHRTATRRRVVARMVGLRDGGSSTMPRLPTPDDIMMAQPAPTRSATALPPMPRAAVDPVDSLPMPR